MSDKLLKEEEKEKKVLTSRDETPTTTVDGQAFGEIDVRTIMVDKPSVQAMIDAKVVTAYKAGGSKAAAEITSALLVPGNEGKVYNASEDFTTTADFVEGAGTKYPAGTNFVVVNTAEEGQTAVYKFDVLGGMDKSVVRAVVVDGLPILPNEAGEATIPDATNLSAGVVKLDDSIDGTATAASGKTAATPKAVADALSAAKGYFDANEHTYSLVNAVDGDKQVLTLSAYVGGTPTSFANIDISAASSAAPGLVKLTDSFDLSSSVSSHYAATPAAVASALSEAKEYTNTSIGNLVDSLSTVQVSCLPSETLSTHVEEDGIVTVTKQAIAIGENQVTNLYTGLKNAIRARVAATRPTTVNGTIDLLMNLIAALNTATAVTPA